VVVGKEGRRETASDGGRDVLIPRERGRKKGKERAMESRDFYTPRKRRPARARALPDAGVAVSACGLAVWSFTFFLLF
jgi:hypothetical protein